MKNLAIILRAMQLYAHNMHNLIKGPTFFQDHEFLGELYPTYEKIYDQVIERIIGLNGLTSTELCHIQGEAYKALDHLNKSIVSADIFKVLLECESAVRLICKQTNAASSLGTQNLLAQISDDSEMRSYKLKQRGG